MTYGKPEVAVLGSASAVIEQVGKLLPGIDPSRPYNTNPAYDLDE